MHPADRPEEGLVLSDHECRAVHELEAALLSDAAFARAVLPAARRLSARAAPVVVGVTADGRSTSAVEWAAAEAAGQGCPLRIVHALRSPVAWDLFGAVPPDCLAAEQTAVAEALDSAVAQVRSIAPGIEVSAHLLQGPAGRVLLAQGRDARLLVLGARAPGRPRGALRRLVGGSLRLRITAAASCPVAVVHPLPTALRSSLVPRVVVGIDGTAGSDEAIGFAFRSARQRGIAVTAVHAWSEDRPADLESVAAPLVRTEAAARALVGGALARWREQYPDVPVVTEVVRRDPATALITGSAGAALVVVGSRGRGRARGAIFGSVSRAVLAGATGPVAVVRHTAGNASDYRSARR